MKENVGFIYLPILFVAILFGLAGFTVMSVLLTAYAMVLLTLWENPRVYTLHLKSARELRKG